MHPNKTARNVCHHKDAIYYADDRRAPF